MTTTCMAGSYIPTACTVHPQITASRATHGQPLGCDVANRYPHKSADRRCGPRVQHRWLGPSHRVEQPHLDPGQAPTRRAGDQTPEALRFRGAPVHRHGHLRRNNFHHAPPLGPRVPGEGTQERIRLRAHAPAAHAVGVGAAVGQEGRNQAIRVAAISGLTVLIGNATDGEAHQSYHSQGCVGGLTAGRA